MGLLDSRVALVTGGAKGIGAASVRALVAEGARVIIGDVLADEAHALAGDIGGSAVAAVLDVSSDENWASAIALAEARFGRLDILVNNAGIGGPFKRVDRLAMADWDRVLAVNLTGTLRGIQAAVPLIRKGGRGGSIINVSSVAGIKAVGGLSAYVASKFAVRGLTKSAALDLGVEGIRVNSLHPGVIETDLSAGTPFQSSHLALPRMGLPAEIADLVVFLASDKSTYATGAEFICDGGEVAGVKLG